MQVKNHINVCMTIHLQILHKSNNKNHSMKHIRNAWLRKYYCRKLDNNKLKYDNHAITKYSISSQIKIETLHDQKYYCRKINNNKLKYGNHAITKCSILNQMKIESLYTKKNNNNNIHVKIDSHIHLMIL